MSDQRPELSTTTLAVLWLIFIITIGASVDSFVRTKEPGWGVAFAVVAAVYVAMLAYGHLTCWRNRRRP